MPTPVLELRGISKRFHQRGTSESLMAVDGANLSVMPGECVALVGESGSGKTTLARIALRLLDPDAGTVLLGGESLMDMSGSRLRASRVAMQPIFQDPAAALNPRLRTADVLDQALYRMRGTKKDREAAAERLLERVGLKPARHYLPRYPHELSGGQRQRLTIARALAMEPVLIIGDEPLSGLDVSIRGQILNLLLELQRERGMAYLLITHDIAIARAVADRTAVMLKGQIVEMGDTAAVFEQPQHEYTRRLLASAPLLEDLRPVPAFRGSLGRTRS